MKANRYLVRKSLFVLFFIAFIGCDNGSYTPKPRAYFRIDVDSIGYLPYSDEQFSFLVSDRAVVYEKQSSRNEKWLNIVYPDFRATLFLTYIALEKMSIETLSDDNIQLLYSHTKKAYEFQDMAYSDSLSRKFGSLYKIKGNVATPYQFFITDGEHNFLRGSLYFDYEVERDSVLPILDVLEQDLSELFNSLTWK